jgi:antitoxin (DNA-binding transcriptional repressor) of toxin-antitoxin stability system
MKQVTITELRRNIFKLIDEALETGEPIVVKRKGRRVVLRGEAAQRGETEAERAERWRRFWAEPAPPGWEDVDLSPEDIRQERAAYWRWDEEPELDR